MRYITRGSVTESVVPSYWSGLDGELAVPSIAGAVRARTISLRTKDSRSESPLS